MLPFGGTRFLYPIGLQHLTGQSINPEEHRRRNIRPPATTDQALRAARPKAVLALDCCHMCHSLPPGSPKRFQNRTGFIAGTAVSVPNRQQPVGTESPSEELSVAGPSCSCRRSYIPAAVTPFPVPLPLQPPLQSPLPIPSGTFRPPLAHREILFQISARNTLDNQQLTKTACRQKGARGSHKPLTNSILESRTNYLNLTIFLLNQENPQKNSPHFSFSERLSLSDPIDLLILTAGAGVYPQRQKPKRYEKKEKVLSRGGQSCLPEKHQWRQHVL